jgi:hypothetical protein
LNGVSRELLPIRATRQRSWGGQPTTLVSLWKRLPTDMTASPARVLQRRALRSAPAAARRLPKQIARRFRTPPDDPWGEGDGLAMHALLAHDPAPRAIAAKLLKGWRRRMMHHARQDDVIRTARPAARSSAEACATALYVERSSQPLTSAYSGILRIATFLRPCDALPFPAPIKISHPPVEIVRRRPAAGSSTEHPSSVSPAAFFTR